jgi:hypothetical protein
MKITEIITIIQNNDLYNVSENIEFAKGKYEYTTSFKRIKEKVIRGIKYKKKNVR